MSLPYIEPMLAQSADQPFSDNRWLFEPKLDGMRLMAYIETGGQVRLMSRRGVDNAAEHPWLVEELGKIGCVNAILDGELVALDHNGLPSFNLLQNRLSRKPPLVYYAFDALYFNGMSLCGHPLDDRRSVLTTLIPSVEGPLQHVMAVEGDGAEMFSMCVSMGLEGVMAKRRSSHYRPGKRSDQWQKFKRGQQDSFVIGGYTPGTGARASTFGALVLGYYLPGTATLRYVGNVGTGFDQAALQRLLPMLRERHASSHFDQYEPAPTSGSRAPGPIQYITPDLVAEVSYMERTADGLLRFPVYLGLREDVAPGGAGPR